MTETRKHGEYSITRFYEPWYEHQWRFSAAITVDRDQNGRKMEWPIHIKSVAS